MFSHPGKDMNKPSVCHHYCMLGGKQRADRKCPVLTVPLNDFLGVTYSIKKKCGHKNQNCMVTNSFVFEANRSDDQWNSIL